MRFGDVGVLPRLAIGMVLAVYAASLADAPQLNWSKFSKFVSRRGLARLVQGGARWSIMTTFRI